jgi:predicted Zn-dependent protease
MTVRWKPLLILSGLFAVTAMVGVLAMAIALAPRSNPLLSARAERKAKNHPHAEIHYKQALQRDGKNPKLLEEMAGLYGEWADRSPVDRAKHRLYRIKYLLDAAKYGKQSTEPRRQLLVEAMRQDDMIQGISLAKELLALDPNSADAHFVLAEDALAANPPNIEEAKVHLDVLDHEKPPRLRTEWIKARVAEATKDQAQLDEVLARTRSMGLSPDFDPVDGMSLVRLRALDAQRTGDPALLAERAASLRAEAARLSEGQELSAGRITQLSQELEKVQRQLSRITPEADTSTKARATEVGNAIEKVAESTFKKALTDEASPDLRLCQAYAEHLLARGKREQCLQVVDKALKTPMASMPALSDAVMSLREVAIKAALSDSNDPERFALAESYIKELIGSKLPYYEGLGHLFQGAIGLEQSGLANRGVVVGEDLTAPQAKLRDEALAHLRRASEFLPRVGSAQALYGVGLLLSQEPALGRQYLQNAQKLGNLEPRYQIWAAWSMVQAGYPEDAQPIVDDLLAQMDRGDAPKELAGTLHLLSGEIHQARRSPAELKAAVAEYEKALAGGQAVPPNVLLRLAQIDVLLGNVDGGLKRIAQLRASGQGGPAVEHLAVLTLNQANRGPEAQKLLDEARRRYPQSGELVALDAALKLKADRVEQADQVLAEFLKRSPDHVSIVQMRAKLLAERLNRKDEARTLLSGIADRCSNSAPLVQLALLDIERREFEAVARTIEKIRSRWKEAAAADQLEAQVAVAQGDLNAAVVHFDAALKKDPGNKIVQLAKAELERQTGASADASRMLEIIARDKPVKELESGLSLATAAQSALASQALEDGDFDGAIRRLEDLLRGNDAGAMARPARWQLVAARVAKGQWPTAKQEIAALLHDPQAPPTPQDRVRAANFYRLNHEDEAARAQLDQVLKADPAQSAAVAVRAFMLVGEQPPKNADAAALVRKAIAAAKEPPPVFYLMLAAIENMTPPQADGLKRALVVLDQGLQKYPESPDLLNAKHRVVRMAQGKDAAIVFVERTAADRPSGAVRRLLANIYHEEQEDAKAEQVLRALLKENPKDRALAASLVRALAAQAIGAAERGDPDRERALNEETAELIRQFRAQFPNDLAFPQAECELAVRRGDLVRAIAIADEVDGIDPNAPAGPLLRARLYATQGRMSEEAQALREALKRNPRQPQIRLLLAQTCLTLGEADEALEQAQKVLDSDKELPVAMLLKSKALVAQQAPPGQEAANRAQALQLLAAAIKRQPTLSDAYHQTALILLAQHKRAEAIDRLKAGLQQVPDDAGGLSLLVQWLTQPREGGQPPGPADLKDARALAEQYGGRDEKGPLCLALSVGFQKANQLELAEPWAEKAAAKLKSPSVQLNLGGVLLALADATTEKIEARRYLDRALAQYDLVLKAQPDSIEAVNNKAWILHHHLGNHQAALELVQGLRRKVDPAILPGEFYDTLGSIQESLGLVKEAEESYTEGLHKAPSQPVLNFHMGRLLAHDPLRTGAARGFLEKALAAPDRLPANESQELPTLLKKMGR